MAAALCEVATSIISPHLTCHPPPLPPTGRRTWSAALAPLERWRWTCCPASSASTQQQGAEPRILIVFSRVTSHSHHRVITLFPTRGVVSASGLYIPRVPLSTSNGSPVSNWNPLPPSRCCCQEAMSHEFFESMDLDEPHWFLLGASQEQELAAAAEEHKVGGWVSEGNAEHKVRGAGAGRKNAPRCCPRTES